MYKTRARSTKERCFEEVQGCQNRQFSWKKNKGKIIIVFKSNGGAKR